MSVPAKTKWCHAPLPDSPILNPTILILKTSSKCLTLYLVYHGRLMAMLAFLHFYTCGDGTMWHAAFLLAAVASGKGSGLAHSLRVWTWEFLEDNDQLPVSLYGKHNSSRLLDEDLAEEIHEHLKSLGKKYLRAMDIVWYLEQPEVKVRLKLKKTPGERTTCRWMHAMQYQYGKAPDGMFVDGHERKDVVAY